MAEIDELASVLPPPAAPKVKGKAKAKGKGGARIKREDTVLLSETSILPIIVPEEDEMSEAEPVPVPTESTVLDPNIKVKVEKHESPLPKASVHFILSEEQLTMLAMESAIYALGLYSVVSSLCSGLMYIAGVKKN